MNQSNEKTEGKQKLQDLLAWLMDKKMYIVIVLLAVGGFYYANRQPAADNSALLSSSQSMEASGQSLQSSSVSSVAASTSSAASAANAEVVCDISGAVKHQGVYRLKNGARLEDLIEKAGGLTKDAQLQVINRSQLLKDQDKIYIPGKGDKAEAAQTANSAAASAPASSPSASASSSSSSVSSSTSGAASGDLINLNTATASDLQKLNGIGEKKAEQIIAYRQEKGSFKSIDELKEVSGIGDKTFAAIKDQLTI